MNSTPKKFEYLQTILSCKYILSADPNKWEADGILLTKLNDLGNEGWELVSISLMVKFNNKEMYAAIFKRERIIS